MTDDNSRKPEDILKEILESLQSDESAKRLSGIAALHLLSYSSQAIRSKLEKLALNDENPDVRTAALVALDLPTHRNIRNFSKINRDNRRLLLQEITEWEELGLLGKENAAVIRRRYDFDLASSPTSQSTASQPQGKTVTPTAPKDEGPRPTLLQTLLSEASIKVYLYLGAFFVIASASIIGAAVPELRLPILVIGTLIFGGVSLAIKVRLPQPSFALFIVFSFLLLITANTIRQSIDLTTTLTAAYWTVIFFMMTIIWSGSTWLYKSRLFSVTAFISLTLAFIGIGKVFNAKPEFYIALAGFAALTGLAGVWLLKKWRDTNFALPLFLTIQLSQFIILVTSISIFGVNSFNTFELPLLNLASLLTWVFSFSFYVCCNLLYPFVLFPWLTAATLIPMPWFMAAAFEIKNLGFTIILLIWGSGLSIISEAAHKFKATREYSLPILIASIPSFAVATFIGFSYSNALGMLAAFGIAIVYTGLHLIRTRWWLWALALFSFIISYFAFFNLESIQKLDVFIGYQALGISILFLLPDLFLKKDLMANREWRLPPRIYGILFTLYTSFALLDESETGHVAICFAIFTLFFAVYALAQRKAIFGYAPAAYLPLTIIFAFKYLEIDMWLPTLTALTVLYFATGMAGRSKESWSFMLRNSALTLGALISFAALLNLEKTDSYGWCVLIIGLLFAIEMHLRRNGLFEIGMPIFFTIGTFMILHDFNFERVIYHVIAYSLVWILSDSLAHLTFTNPRPLKMIVRSIGGLFAVMSYGFLFAESDAFLAATGFGIFTLLFLAVSLLYNQPNLFYAFTLTLPLFVAFLFRSFEITKWIHPVIFIAMAYYGLGFFLRFIKRAAGWDLTLLYSGLGVGVIVSIAAPILGGIDAAIPVAIAATLWAAEALAKKNAWLAFPANLLYLLAYFIILVELKVDQPQFFSMGTALLGLFQHYLLTHTESKTGAFITGMVSQFVLLGTTYIQMIHTGQLMIYFVVLFFQSIAVLIYGLVIRSRSLTFFPIGFVVLGVITVVNNALEGVGAIFVIGCTGIILLILGIFAVLMRERISKFSERISDWKA